MKKFCIGMLLQLIVAIILSLFLCSCASRYENVFVWTLRDVVGLAILALALLVIGIIFLRAWILDSINARKRRRKQRRVEIEKMDLFIK